MKISGVIFSCSLLCISVARGGMDRYTNLQHPADSSQLNSLNIIPRPFMVTLNPGSFHFNKETVLIFPEGGNGEDIQVLGRYLEMMTTFPLKSGKKSTSNYIQFIIDSGKVSGKEGYTLLVDQQHIVVTGHDGAGVFYGLQSLVQLAARKGNNTIQSCVIEDHPRFAYRGVHLDVSRHFFSTASIKKWIDVLAFYKINTFHWHLTDDQGWRIEIKRYPALQTVSAYRNETLIGHKKEIPHRFDGKRYGGYYSQEEIKEIVLYATARHITIIPEIEMPGHALAALAAYPALGCTGGPYQTASFWGIFSDVYCAGNDDVFNFLQEVLDEVMVLFPSKYIHIGGDECLKQRWHECPKCRKRMAEENLKDENELQSYFIKRIEKYLNSKGRQIIGWDEILEGGLSPGATVMSWTGEQGGITAAMQNHEVIMTPEKYVYLDYYQSLYEDEPLAGGGYLPLKKIYEYEPLPPVLSASQAKYIIGVQANVWTEYMDSEQKAEYMMFPRIIALAETAWSTKENRDYSGFLTRLRQQSVPLKKLGMNVTYGFDEITYTLGQTSTGKTMVGLYSTLPQSVIRYTIDGSVPGKNSAIYHKMLTINEDQIIQAAVFRNGLQSGRVFRKRFLFHKAVGRPVSLTFQPSENFNPGNPAALVNGIEGSNKYNDGQWFGFSGVNFEAVIDLGSLQDLHLIGTNILKYHWQRMWEPVTLSFLISADGIDYQEVYQQTDFPVNGINQIRAKLKNTRARFVKITGVNKGVIPEGEYIAGAKAVLMVDEILIY